MESALSELLASQPELVESAAPLSTFARAAGGDGDDSDTDDSSDGEDEASSDEDESSSDESDEEMETEESEESETEETAAEPIEAEDGQTSVPDDTAAAAVGAAAASSSSAPADAKRAPARRKTPMAPKRLAALVHDKAMFFDTGDKQHYVIDQLVWQPWDDENCWEFHCYETSRKGKKTSEKGRKYKGPCGGKSCFCDYYDKAEFIFSKDPNITRTWSK